MGSQRWGEGLGAAASQRRMWSHRHSLHTLSRLRHKGATPVDEGMIALSAGSDSVQGSRRRW